MWTFCIIPTSNKDVDKSIHKFSEVKEKHQLRVKFSLFYSHKLSLSIFEIMKKRKSKNIDETIFLIHNLI